MAQLAPTCQPIVLLYPFTTLLPIDLPRFVWMCAFVVAFAFFHIFFFSEFATAFRGLSERLEPRRERPLNVAQTHASATKMQIPYMLLIHEQVVPYFSSK